MNSVFSCLASLFSSIQEVGGRPYLVGGCVRDSLLGLQSKDVDIEVHGISMEDLLKVLLKHTHHVDVVGKSFGVIKAMIPEFHSYHPYMEALDISLPRTETKAGSGHKGFDITVDPYLGLEKAAARRDFTINSLYMDIEGIRDPFGGQMDLKMKLLRATSTQFAEDPLRVLRALSQAGRFGLSLETSTAKMCRGLLSEYHTLSKERVWGEWLKWATKSEHPSLGLQALQDSGWITLYPELEALVGVPQDPEWHPEGNVWVHTKLVCDAAASIADRDKLSKEHRATLVFAALCHDLAKPACTAHENGRITSKGHEKAGEQPTIELLQRMGYPKPKKTLGTLLGEIVPLVTNHLAHCSLGSPPSIKGVRKLSTKANIEMLARLVEADHSGRPPIPPHMPAGMRDILQISRELKIGESPPPKIITGAVLLQKGYAPGKEMGALIQRAYAAQINGEFDSLESALVWLG